MRKPAQVALCLVLAASGQESAAGPLDDHAVSVTVSPFHAPLPALELTGELRVSSHFSGSLIAGIGRFLDARGHPHDSRELGAQVIYYRAPTFRELHVGVEATYVKSSDTASSTTFTGTALAVGGFVGWKYIHRWGVTLLAQGGVAMGFVETFSRETDRRLLPIVNINAGWSF